MPINNTAMLQGVRKETRFSRKNLVSAPPTQGEAIRLGQCYQRLKGGLNLALRGVDRERALAFIQRFGHAGDRFQPGRIERALDHELDPLLYRKARHQPLGCVERDDLAVINDRHPVAQVLRLLNVMGGQEDRLAFLTGQPDPQYLCMVSTVITLIFCHLLVCRPFGFSETRRVCKPGGDKR